MEITKVYTQVIPQTHFIGKKYGDKDRENGGFGAKWCEAHATGLFEKISASAGKEEFFEDSGAYWFFERYQCSRFTKLDEEGRVILAHCYFAK